MYELSKRVVGSSLRKLRETAGLTQTELAHRLLMPQSYVSKVETGERALRVGEVFAYSEALGIPAEAVLQKLAESLDGAGRDAQRRLQAQWHDGGH